MSGLEGHDPSAGSKWYRVSAYQDADADWQRLSDRAARGLQLAYMFAKRRDCASWLDDRHFRDSLRGPTGDYGDVLPELLEAGFVVRGPDGEPMLDSLAWDSMQKQIDPSAAERQQRSRDRKKAQKAAA